MKKIREDLELEWKLECLYQKAYLMALGLHDAEINMNEEMLMADKRIVAADALRKADKELEEMHEEIRKMREGMK